MLHCHTLQMRLGVLFIGSQVKGVFIQGVGRYWRLRRLSLGQVAGRASSSGGWAARSWPASQWAQAGWPVVSLGSTALLHPTALDTSPSRFEVGMAVTLVLLCWPLDLPCVSSLAFG